MVIEHVEADAARREAEVQTGIIRQVDGLVEYFNGLYDEDRAVIEQLQGEVAAKDEFIAALRATTGPSTSGAAGANQQQHHHHHHHHDQQQQFAAAAGAKQGGHAWAETEARGCWPRFVASFYARPRFWLCWLLIAAALLVLIIGLAAGLGARGRRGAAAPHFLFPPVVLAPSSGTINLFAALSQAAMVNYVVTPTAAAGVGSARDGGTVVEAARGLLGATALEVGAHVVLIDDRRICDRAQ